MKAKHFFLMALCFVMAMPSMAQSSTNEDEVVTISEAQMHAYRPGEVIVKFREDGAVRMKAPARTAFRSSAVSAVDQMFHTLGVDSVEELMPLTGKKVLPKRVKTYSGEIEVKQMGKLYRLKLSDTAMQQRNIFQVIDTLKNLAEVEYAEPNYLVYAMTSGGGDSATYCAEPLYSQQWGPAAINLPFLWNQPKITTKRPVIAILDTGVDIEHPDLAANIWTNTAEANGVDNQDDDNNGFKDDIHGWDFINQTGVIRDFNGHGTHCAGIAAAVGDNGIGITGANPDAYIMPVAVMQSDGSGDIATIIKGIDYVVQNGADIISMSLGTYAVSMALENSLARAYTNSILVAAAGNEGRDIIKIPAFPAAYTFVLGVMCDAGFTNYDGDGPIYSSFSEEDLFNYELMAPGVSILSTFPNGRYKSLNGTSMACPLVAGAISRLLQVKADSAIVSKEVLFGDLIHSREGFNQQNKGLETGNIDMQKVFNYDDATRIPTLWLIGFQKTDTINGDGDGLFDAGETIELFPIFRNDWGTAHNVRFWMRTGFDNQGDWVSDDTTLIHYLTDTVTFNHTLSAYAKSVSADPISFSINPNCPNARNINLTLYATADNALDTLQQRMTIKVVNAEKIYGAITSDFTFTPDKNYIVTSNVYVEDGVTITFKPGVTLNFYDGVGFICSSDMKATPYYENGIEVGQLYEPAVTVIAQGTPDSLITFQRSENCPYIDETGFYVSFYHEPSFIEYYATETTPQRRVDYSNDDSFRSVKYLRMTGNKEWSRPALNAPVCEDCIFDNNGERRIYTYNSAHFAGKYIRCNFVDNYLQWIGDLDLEHCNIAHNHQQYGTGKFVEKSNYYPSIEGNLLSANGNGRIFTENPSYLGSSKEDVVRRYVKDLYSGYGFSYYDLSNMMLRPFAEAHGIVWKVLIDGYDAQDEFDSIPSLGVGTHRCDVYFNRPMDTSKTPFVSFGVRPPYTQHVINEEGVWSSDGTTYSASFTITGKTQTDGLNRIYVADAQDLEHFEIPIENMRFNMQIESAGSMSTGLMATPGLGKVTLNWETDEDDFEDLLGYNIYRCTDDTIRWDGHYEWNDDVATWIPAGWRIDTIQINETLIDSQDTVFVDFDVIPGKTYYYVIKQMTTSLNNYDLSNWVAATPLTSIKGDANGSMTVDVADVITEVNYIARQNPQPFIFEAADVNSDNAINIFDIVGTINLILHPEVQTESVNEETAYYYIEDGILYVESDAILGGVQFTLNADSATASIRPLEALAEFEKVSMWLNEESYMFMAYSMSGKTIGVGKTALLEVGDAELESIALSDPKGHNVAAVPMISTALDGTRFIPGAKKVIEDGQMYIIIGDKKYSVMGNLVK